MAKKIISKSKIAPKEAVKPMSDEKQPDPSGVTITDNSPAEPVESTTASPTAPVAYQSYAEQLAAQQAAANANPPGTLGPVPPAPTPEINLSSLDPHQPLPGPLAVDQSGAAPGLSWPSMGPRLRGADVHNVNIRDNALRWYFVQLDDIQQPSRYSVHAVCRECGWTTYGWDVTDVQQVIYDHAVVHLFSAGGFPAEDPSKPGPLQPPQPATSGATKPVINMPELQTPGSHGTEAKT